MSVALGGNLEDFGIAEVFQLIGQQRKTGLLEITRGGEHMRLAFDSGAVVWASPVGSTEWSVLGDRLVRTGLITQGRLAALTEECISSARPLPVLLTSSGAVSEQELEEIQELLTRETVFEVLRWSEGSFHFSAQVIRHTRPPDSLLAAEQILMDGLRMMDEWRTIADRIPHDGVVFKRATPFEVFRQRASGDARAHFDAAERIYQLIDGRLAARRVIDLSRLGTFEATRAIAELIDGRAIVPVSGVQLTTAVPDKLFRPLVEQVTNALSASVPLALLAIMVCITYGLLVPPPEPPRGFPIVREPLAHARASFDTRRLRYGLHAGRYLTGVWPATLEAQGSGENSLTASQSGSYYYVRSEKGVLLLAPER